MITAEKLDMPTHFEEIRWLLQASRTPRLRTHRQFAEKEIVLPRTGPKGGRRFKCEFQPYTGLWYDAIGSGLFNRFIATGPSQSGKTLNCFVEPIVYHLFERRENVIAFAPDDAICEQKWLIDILPIIQESQYARFLPKRGGGAQGGFDRLIKFANGTYIIWMIGGGGDKNKSAATARVAVGTEVNGMRTGAATSLESGPLEQIEARLRSHGPRAIMYMECTVDTEDGPIWTGLKSGTDSRIALKCPHCPEWVTPEREDFAGWETAQNELEAEQKGRFYCPQCGTGWSPLQRREANVAAKLVHRGQVIAQDGTISGSVPQTRTFSMRWSAVNNLFAEESQIGLEEWKAARKADRESAERERCQFVWTIPVADTSTVFEISETLVASRLTGLPRYMLPADTQSLVCKIDVHARWHYWAVMACGPEIDGRGRAYSVVHYGIQRTTFDEGSSFKEAIIAGLEAIKRELEETEWKTTAGDAWSVDLVDVDAGFEQDAVLEFVTKATSTETAWTMSKGEGDNYVHPKKETKDTKLGNHWYRSRQQKKKESNKKDWWLTIAETNWWMRQVHAGFMSDAFEDDGTRKPGSIALWGDDPKAHMERVDKTISRSSWASQLVAWKWQEKTTPKTGTTMAWVPQYGDGKDDHFFDVGYGLLVASSLVADIRKRAAQEDQAISLSEWFR